MPTTAPPTTNQVRRYRAADLSLADGAAVASWAPTAGTGTPTQGTVAARPAYAVDGIGGKPAIRWPDTASNGDFLQASGMAVTAAPVTIAIILRPAPGSVGGVYQAFHWGIELHTQGGYWRVYNGATLVTSFAHTADAAVITVVNNGNASQVYANGTLVANGNIGAINGTSNTLSVGWHISSNQAARAWRGDIAEIMTYSGVMSAADRATLHSYVQDFYGIAVADYVDTEPPARSGTLNLSGTGTASFAGSPSVSVGVSLSGSGTLSTAGTPAVGGALDLSGVGIASPAGTPHPRGSVPLSGAGTLAATGRPTTAGNVSLSGAGDLTVQGTPQLRGALALAGSGQLDAQGVPQVGGALYLDGAGQLVLVGDAEMVPAGYSPYVVSVPVEDDRTASVSSSDRHRVEVHVP